MLSFTLARPFLAAALSLAALLQHAAKAQTMQPQESRGNELGEGSTIRVFANLLQIPVLVLSPLRQPVKPIDPSRFTIRIDDGPIFQPQAVRLENDDPLTLAVLVDDSHANALVPPLAAAMSSIAALQLRSHDRFVVYSSDGCVLRRNGDLLPVQAALLRDRLERSAAHKPYDEASGPCTSAKGLWASAAIAANALAGEPGRRILVVVTDGLDSSREYDASDALQVAIVSGVAVFAVAERGKVPGPPPVSPDSYFRGRSGPSMFPSPPSGVSHLTALTEGSGGLVLETDTRGLRPTLEQLFRMVRGRYIVEFRRPENLAPVGHTFVVSVGQAPYFIRAAGTSMPIADPGQRDANIQHGPPHSELQPRENDLPVNP